MAKILIAEDDSSMRNFLCLSLKKAGHEVITADDGLIALNIIEKQNTDPGDLDLLLTDIVMPGMDGIELSQKATKHNPEIKIMFITGFAAVSMEKSQPEKNTKLLSKPFHLKDLVNEVNSLLAA